MDVRFPAARRAAGNDPREDVPTAPGFDQAAAGGPAGSAGGRHLDLHGRRQASLGEADRATVAEDGRRTAGFVSVRRRRRPADAAGRRATSGNHRTDARDVVRAAGQPEPGDDDRNPVTTTLAYDDDDSKRRLNDNNNTALTDFAARVSTVLRRYFTPNSTCCISHDS